MAYVHPFGEEHERVLKEKFTQCNNSKAKTLKKSMQFRKQNVQVPTKFYSLECRLV